MDSSDSSQTSGQCDSTYAIQDFLKTTYDHEYDRKRDLDNKANTLVTGASTIATIYGASGVISDKLLGTVNISFSSIPLIAGLVSLVFSIILCAIAIKVRTYYTVADYNNFVVDLQKMLIKDISYKDIKLKTEEINKFRNASKISTSGKIINTYLRTTVLNKRLNNIKASRLYQSQILFIIGIGSIPIFVLLSLLKL